MLRLGLLFAPAGEGALSCNLGTLLLGQLLGPGWPALQSAHSSQRNSMRILLLRRTCFLSHAYRIADS